MTTTQNRIHTLETRSSKYISKILLFPRTLENLIVLEKFGTTTCEVNKICVITLQVVSHQPCNKLGQTELLNLVTSKLQVYCSQLVF